MFFFQALQKDIESHSKIFSAVLKLCERLQSLGEEGKGLDKVTSETLEHRWHTVLLQSLEWQCRLEEAIAGGKVRKTLWVGSFGEVDGMRCEIAQAVVGESVVSLGFTASVFPLL